MHVSATSVQWSDKVGLLRRLARLGRLYDALNSTLETIFRARTPEELYSSVCHTSVHGAKFLAATIFLREPDGTGIKGVASTGPAAKVSIGLKLSVDESIPEGRGWVGEAYRTQKPCFCNDLLTDPRVMPIWRIGSLKTGARSVAALPLLQSGRSIGALAYYSSEFDEFDEEMIKLLQRVSANMSFALGNFEREAERNRAEAATRRASQMYAALSATNEAIMRAKSPDELFQQVCDAAVDGGKYAIAGVLLPETEGSWLRVAAASGGTRAAIEFLGKARISVDEARPEGRGPVGIAFREKTSWTSNDYLNDERTRPWHALVREEGIASNAAIPLIRRGYATGILLFFSSEKDAFDEDIVKLLERLAANVAFALDNFDHEAERKHSQERIQYLATHDGLTGLPNRVMFAELLGMALQSARRYERKFAVLFIDLDRFKVINDTLGHEAGDQLLKEISTRFKASLRASDIVARLGGDEFVVLVQEVETTEQIVTIARKLLSAALKPLILFGQECRVTASIGIAMYPGNGDDEQALMKNADIAMYIEKEEGKNNFQFFSNDIKSQSLERLALENNLRRALERNEFAIHYQAKLDTKSGKVTGVEALLRWNNPELGMVSPMQFIPVAEETGLIVPIGKWVLTTACAQNVAWQRAGLPPVCIAVNLSPRQFADDELLRDLDAALRDSGMDPMLLELEITESMVMGNIDRAARQLTAIKERGVRLAIDDFGTGYSSLAQIKRFPIDTIKVDRSFIRDLPQDSEDRAITQAIIAMGKTLSLTVVAEGVETQAQQDFLTEHACDEMQGFLFSRPIPPEEFADFLREHNEKIRTSGEMQK